MNTYWSNTISFMKKNVKRNPSGNAKMIYKNHTRNISGAYNLSFKTRKYSVKF